MALASQKKKKKTVLKSDAPVVPPLEFVPDHVTPAGVEAVALGHVCASCKKKWSDSKLTRENGDASEPLRHVCYLVSDIIWPAFTLYHETDGRPTLDIWPVVPDIMTAWLCPECHAEIPSISAWALDLRKEFAKKQYGKKTAAGVAEYFREDFDAVAEEWAEERWRRSVEDHCREELEGAYGPSPSAVAIQAMGIIHRDHNVRTEMRELPSEKGSDLRREIKRQNSK